ALRGPMLNDWVYGGYLIWAMPEYPDFIDGRGDIFDWTGVMAEYIDWSDLKKPPNALLDKYHVNFCLLSRQSPMASVLPTLPGWSQVFRDDQSVVVVRVDAKARRQE